MSQKTVLLVDDEQVFLEALADALEYEGHRVLEAATVADAMHVLATHTVNVATVDVMIPAGPELEATVSSQDAGVWLCEQIFRKYPTVDLFCLSVVSDQRVIRKVESFRARFLRKGETPLRTVLNMIRSCLTGIAYSTERDQRRR